MRFMLLIHGNESSWDAEPEAERSARSKRYGPCCARWTSAATTWRATSSRRLRPRSSSGSVMERRSCPEPFAETQEQFGGYFLVNRDLDTALAYAAQIPAAEGGTIEVRPLVEDT